MTRRETPGSISYEGGKRGAFILEEVRYGGAYSRAEQIKSETKRGRGKVRGRGEKNKDVGEVL